MWNWSELILQNFYIFVLAITLALLEIEIEGPNGWAANLPTWRPNKNKWYTKLYASFFSNKELTGYHLTVFFFVLLIFHLPFAFGLKLTIDSWLRMMSLYMNFILLWDFLWFVLNPAFTIKRFNAKNVTWHKKWFAFMPVDYYDNIAMSLVFVGILGVINKSNEPVLWGVLNIILFLVWLGITVVISSIIFQTHKWELFLPREKLSKKKNKKK